MNRNSKRFVFTLSRRLNYLETKLACGNHSATEADYLRAEISALRLVETLGLPAITNGMGRGVVPGGHPLLVTKARGQALNILCFD